MMVAVAEAVRAPETPRPRLGASRPHRLRTVAFPQVVSVIAVSVMPGAVHDPTDLPVHCSHEPMGTGYAVAAA